MDLTLQLLDTDELLRIGKLYEAMKADRAAHALARATADGIHIEERKDMLFSRPATEQFDAGLRSSLAEQAQPQVTHSYTLDSIRAAMAPLLDTHRKQLNAVLKLAGVDKVSDLQPEQFVDVMARIEALANSIPKGA